VDILKKAGFSEVAKLKSSEVSFLNQQNKQTLRLRELKGRILLKLPPFESKTITLHDPINPWWVTGIGIVLLFMAFTLPPLVIYLYIFAIPSIIILTASVLIFMADETTEIKFEGVKFGGQLIVSVPLDKYTGHVPLSVANVAIETKRDFYNQEVWFIASRREIPSLVKGERVVRHDPLLVGRDGSLVDYAVLIAIWGEDIEDLNEYFSLQSLGESQP